MASPYLPYILKDVVTKVDAVFSARVTDPFNVFFDYGLYADVTKNVNKKDNSETYPLIWLVDNWSEAKGDTGGYYGEVTFQIIIAMPTDAGYTAEERSENTFIPRLFPIYEELINQISKSRSFSIISPLKIRHTVEKRSFWGGSVGGTDTKNLFEAYIDALHIPSMTLILK